MMPLSFREAFEAQADRVTDKWDSYLDIYDKAFVAYRDREVSLLEIGIQNGGSLEVHARYFPNHKLIIGCDIQVNIYEINLFEKYRKLSVHLLV